MIQAPELIELLADPAHGLVISPILDAAEQIGPASIDLRLGPDIIVSRRATGATAFDASDPTAFRRALQQRQTYIRRRLGDTFHLQPGEFVIARTLEFVRLPDDISGQALGRSSWGRLGLTIATATMIQPGFQGTITLELGNVANTPLVLKIGLSVAQLVLDRSPTASGRDLGEGPGEPKAPTRSAEHASRALRAQTWLRNNPRPARRAGRYAGQLKPATSRLDRDRDVPWVVPVAVRYVLGVVGERFAGKSTVVSHLFARRGFKLYRFSDVLRDEAIKRGLNPNERGVLRVLGDTLRSERPAEPGDILARLLFARIRADHLDPERNRQPAGVVVEGFKVPAELELLQGLSFFFPLLVGGPEGADTAPWRLRRALTGRLLTDETLPPLPPSPDERLRWFRQHIDEPSDRHPLGPLVATAKARPASLICVDNSRPGTPRLLAQVDALLPQLERRWRDREL